MVDERQPRPTQQPKTIAGRERVPVSGQYQNGAQSADKNKAHQPPAARIR